MAEYGLHPEVAVRYALIREYLTRTGREAPKIVSGYRPASRQKKLLDNWKHGFQIHPEVPMPVSKPACRSRHTYTYLGTPASLAIDVDLQSDQLREFDRLWRTMPYAKSGSDFGDPNHFHVEIPLHEPENICGP